MIRFLRLFPLFRALESDRDATVLQLRDALQNEVTAKLILQDRLNAAEESVSRLWGMVDEAHGRAFDAMKMQVNFATQQKFGVTPYPEASHLPQSSEPDQDADRSIGRRLTPSEMVAQQTHKFMQQYASRVKSNA